MHLLRRLDSDSASILMLFISLSNILKSGSSTLGGSIFVLSELMSNFRSPSSFDELMFLPWKLLFTVLALSKIGFKKGYMHDLFHLRTFCAKFALYSSSLGLQQFESEVEVPPIGSKCCSPPCLKKNNGVSQIRGISRGSFLNRNRNLY